MREYDDRGDGPPLPGRVGARDVAEGLVQAADPRHEAAGLETLDDRKPQPSEAEFPHGAAQFDEPYGWEQLDEAGGQVDTSDGTGPEARRTGHGDAALAEPGGL